MGFAANKFIPLVQLEWYHGQLPSSSYFQQIPTILQKVAHMYKMYHNRYYKCPQTRLSVVTHA